MSNRNWARGQQQKKKTHTKKNPPPPTTTKHEKTGAKRKAHNQTQVWQWKAENDKDVQHGSDQRVRHDSDPRVQHGSDAHADKNSGLCLAGQKQSTKTNQGRDDQWPVKTLTAGINRRLTSSTALASFSSALLRVSSTVMSTCRSSFKCSQLALPRFCSSCHQHNISHQLSKPRLQHYMSANVKRGTLLTGLTSMKANKSSGHQFLPSKGCATESVTHCWCYIVDWIDITCAFFSFVSLDAKSMTDIYIYIYIHYLNK